MKNTVLSFMNNFHNLSSEEVMMLCEKNYLNSEFKINLEKDKTKNAKVSDKKFYLQNGNLVIKFQFDEQTKRLAIYPSGDINENCNSLIAGVDALPIEKIDYFCNADFENLITSLKKFSYVTEVTRKEKFLNNTFIDELVISKYKDNK